MRAARPRLAALGARAVAGEGRAPMDGVDVLFDGERVIEIPGPRVETENVHGTGCTLSAAICARLARGAPLLDAVVCQAYLIEALRRSYSGRTRRGRQSPAPAHRRGRERGAPARAGAPPVDVAERSGPHSRERERSGS